MKEHAVRHPHLDHSPPSTEHRARAQLGHQRLGTNNSHRCPRATSDPSPAPFSTHATQGLTLGPVCLLSPLPGRPFAQSHGLLSRPSSQLIKNNVSGHSIKTSTTAHTHHPHALSCFLFLYLSPPATWYVYLLSSHPPHPLPGNVSNTTAGTLHTSSPLCPQCPPRDINMAGAP